MLIYTKAYKIFNSFVYSSYYSTCCYFRVRQAEMATGLLTIGGGAYWAGRAAARPLFSPCGQGLFFARPLFVVENILFRNSAMSRPLKCIV